MGRVLVMINTSHRDNPQSPEASKMLLTAAAPVEMQEFDWLEGLTFSQALVVCVGAGPWKRKRREDVQMAALLKLKHKDIYEIRGSINWYPLDWQNDMLWQVRRAMRKKCSYFNLFCKYLPRTLEGRHAVYEAAGRPKGTKTLSLFCRDALNIPSFPIDRWVQRWLEHHRLPVDEEWMISACTQIGFDPSALNRGIVTEGFSGNPDWSKAVWESLS
jgi:hypothetical protein